MEERIEAIQTRWSLIRQAHLTGQVETTSQARQLLVLRYAPAIRKYVGAILRDPDQADELSQEVLLRLMRGDFGGADPGRGRFRDLLKTAIRNLIRSHWEKANRRKATAAELDWFDDRSEQEREAEWTRLWQKTVLDHTWNRMRTEEGDSPSAAYWALKLRSDDPDASSEELARAVGARIGSTIRADHCRQLLRRARVRFANHLLDEVRAGLDAETDDRLQEELAALGLLDFVRDYLAADE